MAPCHLRIFPPPTDDGETTDTGQEATVTVRLQELFPVLQQAAAMNAAWLRDFEDDPIRVTPDFYDILRAFANMRTFA